MKRTPMYQVTRGTCFKQGNVASQGETKFESPSYWRFDCFKKVRTVVFLVKASKI
jgi:hypothetical protein